MRLDVAVIPRAKRNTIETLAPGTLKVHLVSPPDKGKANQLLIELLAEKFNVPKSAVTILRGAHARKKTIQITA